MRTTLTIECDIRDAQAILYEASKIIQKTDEPFKDFLLEPDEEDFTVAGQSSVEPPEVVCPFCDWTGYIIELKIDGNKSRSCPKCHGLITGGDSILPKKGEGGVYV